MPVSTHVVTSDANGHDGAFHAATDDPDWAESSCFTVSVPERDINGFIYYFHDVRCGSSGGGPALWDPTGKQPDDCLFYDWRWRQLLTGPIDFDDFTRRSRRRTTLARHHDETRTQGVDKVVGGYLLTEGRMGELVKGERRVETRRGNAPARVVVEAVDDHGLTLRAEGEVRTALRWLGLAGPADVLGAHRLACNGVRGWGENQEFHARERVRQFSQMDSRRPRSRAV